LIEVNIMVAPFAPDATELSPEVLELLDQRIAELVDTIRGNNRRIEALNARIEEAKEELRALLEQRGANWSDEEGYARLVTDTVRRWYDTQALDRLVMSDPLRHGWLVDYRRETPVRGGVKVR
jgi:hypothetical protein